MTRTRAKICGLTRASDIRAAVAAGVDAIGLVFYAPSPRAVNASQAAELLAAVPAYVQVVGLFVNASLSEIQQVLAQVPLDILQFHGDESPEQCRSIAQACARRWYKAIQVKPDLDVVTEVQRFRDAGASAILLDAWHPELKGGTGHSFDWAQLSELPELNVPLILAGGLSPDNIVQAIQTTHVYAVDVSGGVESAKGIKAPALMQRFMQGVLSGSAH